MAVELLFVLNSCKSVATNEGQTRDSVEFVTQTMCDSMNYIISDNSKGIVKVILNAEFPQFYKNEAKTNNLKRLYSSVILGVDSANQTNSQLLHIYSMSMLSKYAQTYTDDISESESECDKIEYSASLTAGINIYSVFNQNELLSICRERIIKNNTESQQIERQYFNIDLNQMMVIKLNDIFDEEDISRISDMLKVKLLEINKVKDEKDLIELGYFNLDNLMANNNFYIDEKGITWNFLPLEIGCFSLGETKIFLSYNDLQPLFGNEENMFTKYLKE